MDIKTKRYFLVISTIILCIFTCRAQVSMQNLTGYPLIGNIDSIKQLLKTKCLDTIKFKKGEIIADIGAGNGYLEGMLSLFNDSLTFYIQDIDTTICNQKSVDKVVTFYSKLKEPYTNKFYVINGSELQTNLPDAKFDKILMLFTYQYLKQPLVFMTDVRKKLKPGGRMYIINPDNTKALSKSIQDKYGWNASPIKKEIKDIEECGFELIKKSKYTYTNKRGNPYIMIFKKSTPKDKISS